MTPLPDPAPPPNAEERRRRLGPHSRRYFDSTGRKPDLPVVDEPGDIPDEVAERAPGQARKDAR